MVTSGSIAKALSRPFAGARLAVVRFAVVRFAAVERFAVLRLAVLRFAVERFAETRDPMDRRPPIGEPRKVVDEPSHCPLHLGEGARHHDQAAERQATALWKQASAKLAEAEAAIAGRGPVLTRSGGMVLLPLLSREEQGAGVVCLERTAPYDERSARVAFDFIQPAVVAVDNARLFSEVKRLATTDALTGISNRRHFLQVGETLFETARRYGQPLSALMLDVDRFKQVNDQHGHAVGDEVLRAAARGRECGHDVGDCNLELLAHRRALDAPVRCLSGLPGEVDRAAGRRHDGMREADRRRERVGVHEAMWARHEPDQRGGRFSTNAS